MGCRQHDPSSDSAGEASSISGVLIVVGLVAVLLNIAAIVNSPLWVYPDSVDYIQLAGGIADRLDLGNELFLIRTPAYPLMLAGIFVLSGPYSPTVIQIVQHGMVLGTVLLTALIGWHLTSRRSIALLAGLLCACSLQVISYANMALTETPYTLVLTACVYSLLRYGRSGSWRFLVYASLMAGMGYLLRPVGLYLVGVCVLAVFLRVWTDRPSQQTTRPIPRILAATRASVHIGRSRQDAWRILLLRRMPIGCALAIIPALALAVPWMVNNALAHESLQASRCLDYVLYGRAVTFDNLDSTRSAAMAEIHEVVEEAVGRGHLPPDADYRDRGTVMQAYATVNNATFAESSAVMGRAGRDLMLEHSWPVAVRTAKYAWWMVMQPDPVYRFAPGGAPGIEGKRDPDAAFYDIGTYSFGPGSWEHVLRDYRHYLPLSTEPNPLTPLWTSVTRWFYRNVDQGPALLGLRDSAFDELMLICLVGGLLTAMARRRGLWLLVAAVVGSQICLSAFLGGPTPRYVVAVKPLLLLYAAFLIISIVRAAVRIAFPFKRETSAVPTCGQEVR